jgi:uncharacterized repeat protein (TIGR03803 family)
MVLAALAAFGIGGARAATYTALHSFCADLEAPSTCLDGRSPNTRLLQVGDELYGTTATGGLAGYQYAPTAKSAYGTLFKTSTTGTFKTLYNFCQQKYCLDGAGPADYLALGPAGEVYGVTRSGGKINGGTVFKLTAADKFTSVYHFCTLANCTDGIQPVSVLFVGGTLFGTASAGGSHGSGTAFSIDSSGTFHVLYNFCAKSNCADGITPNALVRGKDGNFYGTTLAGGRAQAGTIFRMTPAGVVTTLYSFCAKAKCADGEQPNATLALGTDGNFYGTTLRGGANADGAIFKVTPAGVYETLYSFCKSTSCYDGSTPTDGLSVAKDGSFYGTASTGGRFYYGVVFHLTTAGDYSVVYNFCSTHGCFDGAAPFASPTVATDGFLYGTAFGGGTRNNSGTIYRLEP